MAEYEALKARLARGWNTWNARSVLSHVWLPGGFALNLGIKDLRHTAYLKETYIAREDEREERVRPGRRTYNGGYTELLLSWKDLEIEVRSGLDGDDLVVLATLRSPCKAAPSLVVEGGLLWNRPGGVVRAGDRLEARLPGDTLCAFPAGAVVEDAHVPAQGPYLVLPLDRPAGVSTGRARTVAEIAGVLDARRAERARQAESYGDLAEVYDAVQTCLAWDTFYEPSQDRVISPVSRIWSCRAGGYILYCWDVYFAAFIAAIDHPDLAFANAIEMTHEITERGFVPNFAQAGGLKSRDRSEPPVGAMMVRAIHRRHPERWFLEEVYGGLLEWNRWWDRRRNHGGLLSWGSDPYEPLADYYWESAGVNALYGAALESGLDNSPMYDDIPFDGERHLMCLADVGLNSLYVRDCEDLGAIAEILGRRKEAEELAARADTYRRGLAGLWDEAAGIFLNRRTDTGAFSPRMSPTCFYPLIAGAPTPQQVDRMVRDHLLNPQEFWGDHVLPSIARNDPAYADQYYWRGRIWPPMNFLVYLGLHRYGHDARHALAEKSTELLLRGWRDTGSVCENYSPETGAGGETVSSDRFYHWGGLLGLCAFIERGVLAV